MLTFLHAADFHLDSAFSALTDLQAMERRRECRDTAFRLAEYVNENGIDLVLLAGDLFDSAPASRDTAEQLSRALGRMRARVFCVPGNHDWYGPRSPWRTVRWPDNVTVFRENTLTAAEVPEWNLTVYGGAFTGPEQSAGMLDGFTVPTDGRLHIGLLHGEVTARESTYNPIRREDIAHSGLDYLALGHIHKRCEPERIGRTVYAWPGCIEGRGFDELGEKGFYRGIIGDNGAVTLDFVPFARRRYEILEVDVTGRDPLSAVSAALGPDAGENLVRILCTGETGEAGVDLPGLREALAGRTYALELRDHTRLREDLWARCGEDSLRGLFLRELRGRLDRAADETERRKITLAARFGLAALDRRDMA